MKLISLCLMFLLVSCAAAKKKERLALSLNIIQKNPTAETQMVREAIMDLALDYDLETFIITKAIVIDSKDTTHSHPVLTLDTRFARNRERLLSQLIHEELHWWLEAHQQDLEKAMPDMKKAFKGAPQIRGAKDPNSTYKHLIICWMEYMAITKYMGEDTAKSNLKYFTENEDRYPWIYPTVLKEPRKIQEILAKHRLIPAEMFPRMIYLL